MFSINLQIRPARLLWNKPQSAHAWEPEIPGRRVPIHRQVGEQWQKLHNHRLPGKSCFLEYLLQVPADSYFTAPCYGGDVMQAPIFGQWTNSTAGVCASAAGDWLGNVSSPNRRLKFLFLSCKLTSVGFRCCRVMDRDKVRPELVPVADGLDSVHDTGQFRFPPPTKRGIIPNHGMGFLPLNWGLFRPLDPYPQLTSLLRITPLNGQDTDLKFQHG